MQINEQVATRPQSSKAVICALEAVCNELGISRAETHRRDAIARSIEAVWRTGRTQPLDLVDAGLSHYG